jgi:hypothetical protein
MWIGRAIIGVLVTASFVIAAAPTSQPAALSRKRPPMTIKDAEKAMGLLGPVRVTNYSQTFLPPKVDPHQQYRDRFMYIPPGYSPYCGCGYYGGCYPYDPFRGFHYEGWISPSGAFYGD